jgi:retron-type reverse transcriptase
VDIDLSKYFDTINHDLLMGYIRKEVKDRAVLELIKKYLKSGVMVNGVKEATEKGSPQGDLCKALHRPPYAKQVTMQS